MRKEGELSEILAFAADYLNQLQNTVNDNYIYVENSTLIT